MLPALRSPLKTRPPHLPLPKVLFRLNLRLTPVVLNLELNHKVCALCGFFAVCLRGLSVFCEMVVPLGLYTQTILLTDIRDLGALGWPQGEKPLGFGQHNSDCGVWRGPSHLVGPPCCDGPVTEEEDGPELLMSAKDQGGGRYWRVNRLCLCQCPKGSSPCGLGHT